MTTAQRNRLALVNPPQMLSANAVAKRLDVSIRTVWRMLERGELPEPIRLNRKLVRFRTSAIDEWIAAEAQKVMQTTHRDA